MQAVVHLLGQEKLVVEPSGAVSVAAWLRYFGGRGQDQKVVAILTGGNVEPARLAEAVRALHHPNPEGSGDVEG